MDKPFPGNAQFCPMLNSRNSEGPSTSTNYEGPIFSQQFVNYNKARDSYRRQLQMERANLDYELETLHEHDLEFKIEEQEKQKKSLDSKLALMLKTMKETLGSVPSSNGHLESVESLTEWLKTVQVKPNVRKSIREAILSKKKC
ncbi:unnamed protein product [Caenorhabditis angaria]|uniref:Uncharacterized protein n=1 Tax=Caenorhabditis angaria TaxID=860376 RepID=A0A9P1MU67_9PELO|nr:unnamed protein product [Caenorhabditis angaria]